MGGSAFGTDRRLNPRMPPSVYKQTRDSVLAALRTFYAFAETPIEAPEKSDYGDIDVFVCSPLENLAHYAEMDGVIRAAIGAIDFRRGGPTKSFAIPWPSSVEASKEEDEISSAKENAVIKEDGSSSQIFIQVDITTVSSPASFKWQVFNHCHGDFWNMIGSLIRRYGLTASDSGVYIRIAEVEPHNKAAARYLLTHDPAQALNFFGMDEKRFWTPFERKLDLFKYVSSCRFYDPTRFTRTEELKANDRQRVKKRTLFQEWINDYLPTVRDTERGTWADKTREETIDIVKDWFGIGEQFENYRRDQISKIQKSTVWSDIRKELPIEGTRLGIAMKGLKAEIAAVGKDLSPGELIEDIQIRTWFKENDLDKVKKWARENWEEVEERQMRKEKVACAIYFQEQEMLQAEKTRSADQDEGDD